MNLFERLRLFFSGSQPAAPILSPPAIVEQMRVNRGYKAAKQALPWSDDIKAHNHWVNAEHEQRRYYLVTGYTNGSIPLPDGFRMILAKRKALEIWEKPPAVAVETVEEFDRRCRGLAIEDLVEAQMWRESRNVDATKTAPLQPLLTPDERQEAREWGAVKSEVDRLEEHAARRPAKPSEAEVLEAAGGNETRAAQLQAKVDELFGKGTDEKGTEETTTAGRY